MTEESTQHSSATSTPYRIDIQGLRGVAVLAVVLYHANFAIPGGFVGVDVFFVISGYLITTIILRDIAQGSFTLGNFWKRRCLRILPALAATLLAVAITGWYWLLPVDLVKLGDSMVAQSAFAANFYFRRQLNYFQPSGDTLPLLHLWSLAVEEQFYLLMPLLFGVTSKRSVLLRSMLAVCGLSLAASIYLTEGRPTFAFYLLPCRAWELLLGSLIAVSAPALPASKALREVIGVLGLALIAAAFVLCSHDTPFPGVYALLPCVGAALCLWIGADQYLNIFRALRCWPLVFFGDISYPLYLIHWPVFVFARYWAESEVTTSHYLMLIAGCVLASAAIFYFIEKPVRKGCRSVSISTVLITSSAVILCFLALGVSVSQSKGWPARFPAKVLELAETPGVSYPETDPQQASEMNFPRFGSPSAAVPSCLLWGDSHARDLVPAFDAAARHLSLNGAYLIEFGRAPIIDPKNEGGLQSRLAPYVMNWLENNGVRHVCLVGNWTSHIGAKGAKPMERAMQQTLQALRKRGVDVTFVQSWPSQSRHVPRAMAKMIWNQQPMHESLGVSYAAFQQESEVETAIFSKLKNAHARILSLNDTFKSRDGYVLAADEAGPLYSDTHHLSSHGAERLIPQIESFLQTIAAERHD